MMKGCTFGAVTLFLVLNLHILCCTCQFMEQQKCSELDVPICKILGYNSTRPVPDIYMNIRRSELSGYIQVLERTQCSKDILFFMCMMYASPCFEGFSDRVFPCRSVCERVKSGCLQVVTKFHFEWPSELECNKLPDHNTGVCIRPSAIVKRDGENTDVNKNLVDRHFPDVHRPPCKPCPPPKRLKRFRQFKKAAYAFQGVYHSRETTSDGKTKLTFLVGNIYRQRKTTIARGKVVIWVDSLCFCPKLEFEKSYIVIGHEDKKQRILKFSTKTIVVHDSYYWRKRLERWQRKFEVIWRKRQEKKTSLSNLTKLGNQLHMESISNTYHVPPGKGENHRLSP